MVAFNGSVVNTRILDKLQCQASRVRRFSGQWIMDDGHQWTMELGDVGPLISPHASVLFRHFSAGTRPSPLTNDK